MCFGEASYKKINYPPSASNRLIRTGRSLRVQSTQPLLLLHKAGYDLLPPTITFRSSQTT